MALFGYPAAQKNNSERAVRAALATHRALAELNRMNADISGPALAARIAIDSGPVAIDAAGRILGEVPSIVAQARALVEPGAVVVTARVQRQVAGLFVANERGSYQLKGVPEEVTLYRIVRATGGGHPRPNYYRLIARAVKGLDRSSAEARNAVYERARKALVAQLRFNQPALSKADIAKERLVLEEAIRKVEAEAARKSRTEIPTEPRSATPPAGAPDSGAQAASRPRGGTAPIRLRPIFRGRAGRPRGPDAREQLLSGQSSLKKQAVKRFRDVDDFGAATAEAATTVDQTRDAYEEEAPQYPAEEPAASSHKFEPHLDSEDVNSVDYDTWQERDLELAYEPEEEQSRALPLVRHRARGTAPADEYERTRRPFSYGGLVRLIAVLIILAGVVEWYPGNGPRLRSSTNSSTRLERRRKPGQPQNAVSAIQILGPRSRRSKVLGRRQGRRCRARKRRRPSRSRLCSTRRTGTTSRADATWAPPSGVRKQFRRALD